MKSTISWDITPYRPLKVNRRFGGTSLGDFFATYFHAGFLLRLFVDPKRDRRHILPKCRLNSDGCLLRQRTYSRLISLWVHTAKNALVCYCDNCSIAVFVFSSDLNLRTGLSQRPFFIYIFKGLGVKTDLSLCLSITLWKCMRNCT
jgi:hypothetical protein